MTVFTCAVIVIKSWLTVIISTFIKVKYTFSIILSKTVGTRTNCISWDFLFYSVIKTFITYIFIWITESTSGDCTFNTFIYVKSESISTSAFSYLSTVEVCHCFHVITVILIILILIIWHKSSFVEVLTCKFLWLLILDSHF